MTDFLLELLSEEIPARMQERARADLARLFADEIGKAGLETQAVETYSTPRRLALIARGLPEQTEAVREEIKGPRASAPPQALEGFLRKTGLAREQLTERDGVLFAVIEKPGRAVKDVLVETVPAIVRAFPWPKSMRWGDASISTESLRWVRPLQGIVALFGEEIVEFEIAGIRSGAATVGHRFHHPGPITIGSAGDYAEKLRACHVILDHEERKRLIAEGAKAAAEAAGLGLVEDEGLLVENAGLTEWPVPLLGSFDPAFLQVPREVIQLTMRTNQKYFALTKSSPSSLGEGDHPKGGGGARSEAEGQTVRFAASPSTAFGGPPPRDELGEELAPNFICTANIDAHDGGAAIVAGNQKVLAARLSDAKFFWEQDLKVPLEEQAKKLDQIVFHEKLGTVADKVERVAKLARWLVEEGVIQPSPPSGGEGGEAQPKPGEGGVVDSSTDSPLSPPRDARRPSPPEGGEGVEALATLAETAARLCKADLVTGMVGEFPELQGVMGGYYARAQGLPTEVADAIRDHYKPVGQGDEVPTAPVTVAVSLADKLDTIGAFFSVELYPTGSKDPFALRRAMLGVIQLILKSQLRLCFIRLSDILELDIGQSAWLFDFLDERLKVQQREAGTRHDLFDAVFDGTSDGDIVRLLARVKALQAFVGTEDGANLLTGYRRAANILKKEGWDSPPPPAGEGQLREAKQGEGKGSDAGALAPSPRSPVASRPSPPEGGEGEKSLSYTPLPEESALIAALDSAGPRAAAAVEAEDFEGAMTALASLRGPIDAFFDKVTVNDPDPQKREARLALLARIRDAVHQVADFSRIEG